MIYDAALSVIDNVNEINDRHIKEIEHIMSHSSECSGSASDKRIRAVEHECKQNEGDI